MKRDTRRHDYRRRNKRRINIQNLDPYIIDRAK